MNSTHEQDRPLEGSAAQGRELFYWLSRACTQIREEAGASREDIAHYARVGKHIVDNFEKVKHMPGSLDTLICAYARVIGWPDERDVYLDALDLWIEQANPARPPDLMRPDERVAYETVMARKRQDAHIRREARHGRGEAPRASRKRRAAG